MGFCAAMAALLLGNACTEAIDTQDARGDLDEVTVATTSISHLVPTEGPSVGGTIVAIHGSGFTADADVRVGVRSAPTVVYQSEKLLVALVPPGDGSGPADVTVVAGTTEATSVGGFTYWDNPPGTAPKIAEIRPATGPSSGGTVALLKGENFGAQATVFVGFRPSPQVVVANSTTVTFIVPPGTVGKQPVALVNPDGQVTKVEEGFEYYSLDGNSPDPPQIGAVSPEQVLQQSATDLQVTGTGFAPDCIAMVGGFEAAVVYLSPIELRVTMAPLPVGFADLHVTNGDGQSGSLLDGVEVIDLAPGECATKPQLCPPGTYCNATACVPKLADDAACVANLQCASTVCDGGRCAFTCNPTPPQCDGETFCTGTACIGKKADTESCTEAFECTSAACTGGFCGTGCAAAPDGCGADNYCDGVDCQPLKPDGQPCSEPIECEAGICSAGLCGQGCQAEPLSCGATAYCDGVDCAPKKGGGEPCAAGVECLSSACDTGVDPAVCGGCSVDSDCDDGNPCTDDVCGAGAACEATPNTASCDDGNPCTYDDACMAAACVGQAVTCDDDAGVCGANRSCNGTSTCTETFPDGGTGCDDGEACTHSDACNGSGSCGGTAITCSDVAGTCGANRACNGTSSCTETFPGSGTSCNDSNACTHSDKCNGSGGCSGTTVTCNDGAGVCGANRACNGTANCTVTFPGTGTACNDNNACTVSDRCNGSGNCVSGGSAADGTECGNPAFRCCGGACADMTTNTNHCGGCNLACAPGQGCQNITLTPACATSPPATSGRCTCAGATSQCPNNTNLVGSQGQVCRAGQPQYNNICSPVGNAGCAPGQTDINLTQCPDYCVY